MWNIDGVMQNIEKSPIHSNYWKQVGHILMWAAPSVPMRFYNITMEDIISS